MKDPYADWPSKVFQLNGGAENPRTATVSPDGMLAGTAMRVGPAPGMLMVVVPFWSTPNIAPCGMESKAARVGAGRAPYVQKRFWEDVFCCRHPQEAGRVNPGANPSVGAV